MTPATAITPHATTPRPVRAARYALGLVCAYHLSLAVTTTALRQTLRSDIASTTPSLGPTQVDDHLSRALIITLGVHLPLFVLTLALARALPSGRAWVLRVSTVSQVFGVGFAYTSTPPFPALHPWIPAIIAAQAAVVVLLWLPESARSFFHARRLVDECPRA